MRSCTICLALIGLLALGAAAQVIIEKPAAPKPAAEAAPAAKAGPEAAAFIRSLCERMGSQDARLRFAVREALVVMGHQAVALLKEAATATKDPHLKAFIGRTLKRIRAVKKRRGRLAAFVPGRDLDRVAMDAGLTLEQVSKLAPIFAKHDRNVKELWAEFRESGGFRDREAYKDLQEELKLLVEDAEPELKKILGESQLERVRRHLRRGASGAAGGGAVRIMGPGGEAYLRVLPGAGGARKGKKEKP